MLLDHQRSSYATDASLVSAVLIMKQNITRRDLNSQFLLWNSVIHVALIFVIRICIAECHLLECDAVWLLQEPTFRRNVSPHQGEKNQLLVTANAVPTSLILSTLMMGRYAHPKCRFLQEPHGVTSQNTVFFVVTVVKTSDLTQICSVHHTA
jgi:hypothetical protein